MPMTTTAATDIPLPSDDDDSNMDADDSAIINGPTAFDLGIITMIEREMLTPDADKEVLATRPLVAQRFHAKYKLTTERTSPSPSTTQTPSKRAKK